jgi:hypothetical protein
MPNRGIEMKMTNEPQARRVWVVLSWMLSLLMAYRGGERLLAGDEETRPIAVMLLVAAILICPPIVHWLRRFVPVLRPPWSPPGFAVALLFLSVVTTVVPEELAKLSRSVGPNATSEADERMTPVKYAGFAQFMLERHLTDPQSLQLYSLTAFETGDELALCGTFNARNRMGGYAGESPFVISDRGVFLGERVTAAVVARDCAGVTVTEVPRETLR